MFIQCPSAVSTPKKLREIIKCFSGAQIKDFFTTMFTDRMRLLALILVSPESAEVRISSDFKRNTSDLDLNLSCLIFLSSVKNIL